MKTILAVLFVLITALVFACSDTPQPPPIPSGAPVDGQSATPAPTSGQATQAPSVTAAPPPLRSAPVSTPGTTPVPSPPTETRTLIPEPTVAAPPEPTPTMTAPAPAVTPTPTPRVSTILRPSTLPTNVDGYLVSAPSVLRAGQTQGVTVSLLSGQRPAAGDVRLSLTDRGRTLAQSRASVSGTDTIAWMSPRTSGAHTCSRSRVPAFITRLR